MTAYLNAFELTPTNQKEQRKNPKTANGIFQVVQLSLSLSEPEPASPRDEVSIAGSTSDVKNTSGVWTMKTIYTGSDHLSSQGHSMEYSLNKDYGYGA